MRRKRGRDGGAEYSEAMNTTGTGRLTEMFCLFSSVCSTQIRLCFSFLVSSARFASLASVFILLLFLRCSG
eukprot:m.29637 g.29637  ORF g.29637 m.29637 type:complete len:71 (-) comp10541_c0_seq4:3480-3692(-)